MVDLLRFDCKLFACDKLLLFNVFTLSRGTGSTRLSSSANQESLTNTLLFVVMAEVEEVERGREACNCSGPMRAGIVPG